ncbi:MAG TPA: regulatory protein RecX [Microbacteriaceae bacterium]|nr:regulatory protein RecX [Microbacteriaceae bacterium]
MSRLGGTPEESGGAPVVYLPWVQNADRVAPATFDRGGTVIEQVEHEVDEADRADALVLKKLSRHGLSQREVERILALELPPESVALNVSRYVRLGYIDDDRLAESIVRSQRDRKGAGRANIRRELSTRGIPDGVIERHLVGLDDETELERATDLAEQRLRRLLHEPAEVQERRIVSFLQRRGYSHGLAARALSAAREQLNF